MGGSDTAAPTCRAGTVACRSLATRVQLIVVPRGGPGAALPDIASSAIRATLAQGGSVDGQVPPQVSRQIAREGWYRAAS